MVSVRVRNAEIPFLPAAACDRAQKTFLDIQGAEISQLKSAGVGGIDHVTKPGIAISDFFRLQDIRNEVHAGSAELVRHGDSEQAEFSRLRHDFGGNFLVAVPSERPGGLLPLTGTSSGGSEFLKQPHVFLNIIGLFD